MSKKISELERITELNGADLMLVSKETSTNTYVSRSITYNNVKNNISASVDSDLDSKVTSDSDSGSEIRMSGLKLVKIQLTYVDGGDVEEFYVLKKRT